MLLLITVIDDIKYVYSPTGAEIELLQVDRIYFDMAVSALVLCSGTNTYFTPATENEYNIVMRHIVATLNRGLVVIDTLQDVNFSEWQEGDSENFYTTFYEIRRQNKGLFRALFSLRK